MRKNFLLLSIILFLAFFTSIFALFISNRLQSIVSSVDISKPVFIAYMVCNGLVALGSLALVVLFLFKGEKFFVNSPVAPVVVGFDSVVKADVKPIVPRVDNPVFVEPVVDELTEDLTMYDDVPNPDLDVCPNCGNYYNFCICNDENGGY